MSEFRIGSGKLSALAALGAVVLMGFLPAAQAELKIGVINTQALLQASPQAEAVQKKLRGEFEPRTVELKSRQEKLAKLQQEFQKNAMLLSEEQREKKERDLVAKGRDFKNAKEALEDDFRMRQQQELGKLQEQLLKAVEQFAKRNKYDLILADGVIFASPAANVTEQVLNVLKQQK